MLHAPLINGTHCLPWHSFPSTHSHSLHGDTTKLKKTSMICICNKTNVTHFVFKAFKNKYKKSFLFLKQSNTIFFYVLKDSIKFCTRIRTEAKLLVWCNILAYSSDVWTILAYSSICVTEGLCKATEVCWQNSSRSC